MSDISQVTVGGTTYDIKDATARTDKDKVAQYNANVATDNSYYPVVFSYSTSSSDVTTYLKKTNSIYYNPYAKDLRVSGINSTTGKSHATSVYYDRLRVYDQYFEDPMDVSSLVEECIEISPTDITFTEGDTWDGTNSSLKTAVTALKSNLTDLDNAMEKTITYGTTTNSGFVVTVNHTMVTFRGFYYAPSAVSAWTWLFDLSGLPTKYKPKAYSSDIGISTSQANVRLRMTTNLYVENTAQLNGGCYSITVMWQMRGE